MATVSDFGPFGLTHRYAERFFDRMDYFIPKGTKDILVLTTAQFTKKANCGKVKEASQDLYHPNCTFIRDMEVKATNLEGAVDIMTGMFADKSMELQPDKFYKVIDNKDKKQCIVQENIAKFGGVEIPQKFIWVWKEDENGAMKVYVQTTNSPTKELQFSNIVEV